MSKRIIIITSVVAVLLGTAIFGVVLVRSRVLSDTTFKNVTSNAGAVDADSGVSKEGVIGESGGIIGSSHVDSLTFLCGDGVCEDGENSCNIDCGSGEVLFQSSVSIQPISDTSMRATWKTRTPSSGVFKFGTNAQVSDGSVTTTDIATEHALTLNGLSSRQNYYFAVTVTENENNIYEYGPYLYENFGQEIN